MTSIFEQAEILSENLREIKVHFRELVTDKNTHPQIHRWNVFNNKGEKLSSTHFQEYMDLRSLSAAFSSVGVDLNNIFETYYITSSTGAVITSFKDYLVKSQFEGPIYSIGEKIKVVDLVESLINFLHISNRRISLQPYAGSSVYKNKLFFTEEVLTKLYEELVEAALTINCYYVTVLREDIS